MDENQMMEEEKGLNLGEAPIPPMTLTGEGNTEEGHREELVELSDIKLVDGMTKDQLNVYAIARLGMDLKLSDGVRVKLLRTKVIHMIRDKLKVKKEGDDKPVLPDSSGPVKTGNQPEFVFNPKNRKVFEWTEALGAKADLVPCWLVDIKGNKL